MAVQRKLNLDIAGSVSEFESIMKEFPIQRILYKIIFRGKGLEFDSFRDFSNDDDAGDIDWKASMRANKLLVKQYIEERDLKIVFAVDVSENMVFGSTEKLKCEYASELCAALSHLIINSGDRVGFILFSDRIVKEVLPVPGARQFNIFVDELSNPLNYGGNPKMKETLDFMLGYLNETIAAVILVSDFVKFRKEMKDTLSFFSNKFETIAIMIKDPLDMTLPDVSQEVVIEDPSTGQQIVIDPSIAKKTYEKYALEQESMVKEMLAENGIDCLKLMTDKPFPFPLSEFLKERVEKRKYITPKI